MTSMNKSAAFHAGVRDGMRVSAMRKEAVGFSGLRRLATKTAPFVAEHVTPMISAAQSGAISGGAGGAVAGAAGSAVSSLGQMIRSRGAAGAAQIKNPLLHRLGGALSAGGNLVGAMG
jgi:hypothetical protein